MGGTGATTLDGAKEALGIPSGTILSYEVLFEGDSHNDVNIPNMTSYKLIDVIYTTRESSGSVNTGVARFDPAIAAEIQQQLGIPQHR